MYWEEKGGSSRSSLEVSLWDCFSLARHQRHEVRSTTNKANNGKHGQSSNAKGTEENNAVKIKLTWWFDILLDLLLSGVALKALCLERRVYNDCLASDGDRLGVCRAIRIIITTAAAAATSFPLIRCAHLPRGLGQHIETVEVLTRGKWQIHPLAFVLPRQIRVFILVAVGKVGELMEAQQDALSIP